MKSNDPENRIPSLVVQADVERVKIHPKPINELDRKDWPGRGVAENILQSEQTKEPEPEPVLTGKGD